MPYTSKYMSPIGQITLASDTDGHNLAGLWLEGQKYYGGNLAQPMVEDDSLPLFLTVKAWLESYFAGGRPSTGELPLAPVGSAFRQAVWAILSEIPYGELTTYGRIARQMAANMDKQAMSSQAVGGAVGHNPISVIIPCHRVVGSNGSLTGYAGGIGLKVRLLELEGVDMSGLFMPKRGTAL